MGIFHGYVSHNQMVPETQSFTDRSLEATATRIHDDPRLEIYLSVGYYKSTLKNWEGYD